MQAYHLAKLCRQPSCKHYIYVEGQSTKYFFLRMGDPDHKLNYLLPKRREIPDQLRQFQQYNIDIPHTEHLKNISLYMVC